MDKIHHAAVLIDAENIPPAYADQIFETAQEYGTIEERELFGNDSSLSVWTVSVYRHLIHPNLTVKTTKGKNTSDISLVIRAMDILAQGKIDTMILVSSDSDFSALAVRLRSAGINVIGIGKHDAPMTWKIACSSFVELNEGLGTKRCTDDSCLGKTEFLFLDDFENAPSSVVSDDQRDRHTVVADAIREYMAAKGEKITFAELCSRLNQLPAYLEDKKAANISKAHQYIETCYSDIVRFRMENNTEYVLLKKENALNAVSTSDIDDKSIASQLGEGVTSNVIKDVAEIVRMSKDRMSAYKQLRTKFGNTLGTDYYRKIRSLMPKRGT